MMKAALVLLVLVALCEANTPRRRTPRRRIPFSHCHNTVSQEGHGVKSLEAAVRDADVVLTGKVMEQEAPREFRVRVKRVLKGGEELGESILVREMEQDKKGCRRGLKVRHTAVLLAKHSPGEHMLELTREPLPLTLRNLDQVDAAVKDITYKPRPPIIEEPCEKTFCAYGASCVQTPEGRAECQCPAECPTVYTPVCGTDGVTYTNHCMMRMKACHQEQNTRVLHAGECDSRQRNPKRHHHGRKES